jgi:DNA-binding PadR family transcriptional regulator
MFGCGRHFHGSWAGGPPGGWQRGAWRGFGAWGPPFGGPGRGPRVRRGNVRAAILALLAERPMHGYEMIQELEARTDGLWRPSAGSIYPTLQLLEEEGLVTGVESEGKRRFSLTDAGRVEAEGLERPPWEEVTDAGEGHASDLRESAFQLGAAVVQVVRTGSEDQIAKTRDILNDARRRVYSVLGEDGEA